MSEKNEKYSASDYKVHRIRSFEDAETYKDVTNWDFVNAYGAYRFHASFGNRFYILEKKGWKDVPKIRSENYPCDSYGLSLVAVQMTSINEVWSVSTRWNNPHKGGDDDISEEDLRKLLGDMFMDLIDDSPRTADLTYEEFREIAMTPCQYDGESIFRLDIHVCPEKMVCPYPKFELWRKSKTYHDTKDSAIEFLKNKFKLLEGYRIYCAYVFQIPLNPSDSSINFTEGWMLDGDGNVIERTLCADTMDASDVMLGIFRGRDNPRFKCGDVVEYIHGSVMMNDGDFHEAELGVVVNPPYDTEWYWKKYIKHTVPMIIGAVPGEEIPRGYVRNDYSDDNYDVMGLFEGEGCGDTRVESMCVHPLHFSLPEEYRKGLMAEFERVLKEYYPERYRRYVAVRAEKRLES